MRSSPDHRRRRPGGCGRHDAVALAVALPLAGCGMAPSVNVLGSFFPAWLISIVIGVVLTIVSVRLLVATGIDSQLGPSALVYPCLAGLWIFATWLVLFGS
jgi:hypothetical protein